jgi:hypothetical protein
VDLPTTAFLTLRERFFDGDGEPIPFSLRQKGGTQDDPLDEMIATVALSGMPGILCDKASGPLITPDLVLCRQERCGGHGVKELVNDLDRIVGVEVKKLERTARGGVARASGLDYNTTPPCGRMRVYDQANSVVDIRGFYLFICLEEAQRDLVKATAMALVDGNLLNSDFDYYLSIVGQREKRIGLGTYGDGADRVRPMVIFGNPIGIQELSRGACLVHPEAGVAGSVDGLELVGSISRTATDGAVHRFSCYRTAADGGRFGEIGDLLDPFPTPSRRKTQTSARGRFKLSFQVEADQES